MKHLFVPYELALLAKNKGFDEECIGCFTHDNEEGDLFLYVDNNKRRQEEFLSQKGCTYVGYQCLAPLYQQLVDWFREKHGIEIYYLVNFYNKSEKLGYTYCIDRFINDIHTGENFDDAQMELLGDKKGFNTHLEALEKAFEEAFKLI